MIIPSVIHDKENSRFTVSIDAAEAVLDYHLLQGEDADIDLIMRTAGPRGFAEPEDVAAVIADVSLLMPSPSPAMR